MAVLCTEGCGFCAAGVGRGERAREIHTEPQTATESQREPQRAAENHREPQKETESHREPQKATESHRAVRPVPYGSHPLTRLLQDYSIV